MTAGYRYIFPSCILAFLLCVMPGPGGRAQAQTWQKLAPPATSPLPDLYAIHFITASNAYTCGRQSGSGVLYATTNAGTSWTRVTTLPGTPGPLNDVQFPSSTVGIVAGDNRYVAVTIDGGSTWLDRSVPTSVWPSGGHIQGLYFKDANIGFVVGTATSGSGPRMARTVNGGVTWFNVPMTGANNNLYDIDFFDANRGVTVGTGDPPRKSATTDRGVTWEPDADMGTGADESRSFYAVDAVDETTTGFASGGRVIGANAPEVRKTLDGGRTWSLTTGQPSGNRALNGIIAITRTLVYASGDNGTLHRTMNGGTAWIPEQLQPATSYHLRRFSRAPDQWLYVVGEGGSIYRTQLFADAVFPQALLDFEKLCPGQERVLTITVGNSGGAPLVIDSIVITQPGTLGIIYDIVSHPDTILPDTTGEIIIRARAISSALPGTYGGHLRVYNNDENRNGADRSKQIRLSATVLTKTMIVKSGPFAAGSIPVGTERSLGLTELLRATGECGTAITSVRLARGTDFRIVTPVPTSVAPDRTANINLIFSPTAACARYDTVIIEHNAMFPASPLRVPVSGIGLIKSFGTLPADTLHFGGVLIAASEPRTLLLENRGLDAECLEESHVTSFIIEGDNASEFSTTFLIGSGRRLPAGSELQALITATPAAQGIRTARVIIEHDANPGVPDTVVLIVNGLRPDLVSASPEIRFPTTDIGGRRDSTLTDFIINLSSADVDITGFRIVGTHQSDFTYGGPQPSYTIPVSQRRTIIVSFHPSGTGTRTARLELLTATRPTPLSIDLIGNGAFATGGARAPEIAFQGTEISTCRDTVAHAHIYNAGDAPLRITGAAITASPGGAPGDPTAFTLISPVIPPELVIGPRDSADVVIRFCPTETRIYRARLVLQNNTEAGTMTIELIGPGRSPTIITSDSIGIIGTRVLTSRDTTLRRLIANDNAYPVRVDSITFSGDDAASFSLAGPVTPFDVPALGEADITIRFAAVRRGLHHAVLTVHTTAGSWSVTLGGLGIYPLLKVTPESTAGRRARIGTTRSIRVDITNLDDPTSDVAQVENVTLNGSAAFVIGGGAGSLPLTLIPGQSASFFVDFTPDRLCEQLASFTVHGEGLGGIYVSADTTVELAGIGVAPLVSTRAPEISFGLKLLGSQSDSTLDDFLGNVDFSGSLGNCLDSTNIDSMVIAGPGAPAFSLIAPPDPLLLRPFATGAFQPFTLRFQPGTTGAKAAELLVYFDGSPDSVRRIRLLGASSVLALEYGPFRNMIAIDFGDVQIGGTRDSIFTIINTSDEPVVVDEMLSTLPDVMTILSPTGSFTLSPAVPQSVAVRFAPVQTGAYQAQVVIRSNDLADSSFTLIGNGVDLDGPSFEIRAALGSDLTGSPGNIVEIPLALDGEVIDAGFSELDITLGFTRTLLKPLNVIPVQAGVAPVAGLVAGGTGRDGTSSFRLTTSGTFAPGIVARVAFRILLPDTLETTVRIDSTGVPDRPEILITTDSVRFTISDFCDPKGRLIRFDSLLTFATRPNPATRAARFDYTLPAAVDVQLSIYDAVGSEVARLAEGPYQPGSYSAVFDASTLATGTYYCMLTAGRFSKTLILRIQE